jgi:probable rRNA maturation factor
VLPRKSSQPNLPRLKLKIAAPPRLLTKPETRRLAETLNRLWNDFAAAPTHVEVNWVDENTIRALHRDFLQDDSPTDVITFDLGATPEGWRMTAIAVCVPVAQKHAGLYGVSWREELHRLVIHGALHLLGFDDHTTAGKKRMRYYENKILRQLREPAGTQSARLGI